MTAAAGFDTVDVAIADARYGRLAYFRRDDPIGASLRMYGEWAQLELDVLLRFVGPGDTVVDVGANVGTHTTAFANAVGTGGRVIAFEPQPRVFELLERNVQANGYDNVSLYRFALGAERSVRYAPPTDYAAHVNVGAVSLLSDAEESSHPVDVVTLDSFELDAVRLIKIDVEGMECDVLRGAVRTLRRCRPVVSVECNSAEAGAAVLTLLADAEYTFSINRTAAFNPANHRANPMNRFGATTESSILCLPRELHDAFAPLFAGIGALTPVPSAPDFDRLFHAGPRPSEPDELVRLRYRVVKNAFELAEAERKAAVDVARAHEIADTERSEAELQRVRADSAEQRAASLAASDSAAQGALIAAEERAAHAEHRAAEAEHRAAGAEHRAAEAEHRAAEAEHRAVETEHRAVEAEHRAGEAEQRAAESRHRAAEAEQRIAEAEQRIAVVKHRVAEAEQRAIEAHERAEAQRLRTESAEQRATLLVLSSSEAHVAVLAAEQRVIETEQRAAAAAERASAASVAAAELEGELQARDAALASILASRSWRLTVPLRRLKRGLVGTGRAQPSESVRD
jgi:FkbM family methyltransferase